MRAGVGGDSSNLRLAGLTPRRGALLDKPGASTRMSTPAGRLERGRQQGQAVGNTAEIVGDRGATVRSVDLTKFYDQTPYQLPPA